MLEPGELLKDSGCERLRETVWMMLGVTFPNGDLTDFHILDLLFPVVLLQPR